MKKLVLFDGSSEFGDYQVAETIHNGRKSRVLYSGGKAPQSGIALDDEPELLFNYNQRFLEIAESIKPKSVLLIGGGAFTLPKAIIERFPDTNIDVVEIDVLLPKLAKEYFDLPASRRLKITVGDGREYLDKNQNVYDLIIVDAFSEHDIPLSLINIEAVKLYHQSLTKKGVIAINFIAKYDTYQVTLAHQLTATFKTAFNTVEVYPADTRHKKRSRQNLVLIASRQDRLSLDYLHSVPVGLLFMPEDGVIRGS